MQLTLVTEGSRTEVIYFRSLVQAFARDDVRIFVGTKPDPLKLLSQAIILKKETQSEVWVVLDAETPGNDRTRDRRLKKALQEGKQHGVHFAISTPCFEAWLLAHFGKGPKTLGANHSGKHYADQLSAILGKPFKKGDYETEAFLEPNNLQAALNSAVGSQGLADLVQRIIKQ